MRISGALTLRYCENPGYEADRVHDQGMSGEKDSAVWKRVCAEQRFFITIDLDFADVRQYLPGSHPGILLLRTRNRSRSAILGVLKRVLNEQPLDNLVGCLSVADETHTRNRIDPERAVGSYQHVCVASEPKLLRYGRQDRESRPE